MEKRLRGFIVLLVLVLISASLTSGLKLSVSAGDARGCSGYTEILGAKTNDQILESTIIAGCSLSQSFQGSGDKAQTFSATNTAGDHADVGFNIVNSKKYSGNYRLSPNTANYAQAEEALDVNIADSINVFGSARSRDGYENVVDSLSVTKGSLVGYTNSAYATLGTATVNQKFKSASGKLIDVQSHAENKGVAKEYLSDPVYIYHGGADFLLQTKALKNTQLSTIATADSVLINPTLPAGTKTAMILEPMYTIINGAEWQVPSGTSWITLKSTDLGNTVIPDLASKGYATLRYTDSGATYDKFQNLGQYDVVLVNSHMNSDRIGLSTVNPNNPAEEDPYVVLASQLNYHTSKKSFVILSGCLSFAGYPTQKSDLAKAVSSAYLSAGEPYLEGPPCGLDYWSYFFDALRDGSTTSNADAYANNLAMAKWGSGYTQPVFYPTNWQHGDFKL